MKIYSLKNRRLLFMGSTAIIVIGVILVYLILRQGSKVPTSRTPLSPAKGTTSKGVPHTIPPSTDNNPIGSGGVIDSRGQVHGQTPPQNQWTTSSTGNITLQQPTSGSSMHSGDTISGLAKVSTVQFILKDNAVGLISQGTLNVENGKFSGIVTFKAHSPTGQLEVYYPNPATGAEEDIIDINVQFGG